MLRMWTYDLAREQSPTTEHLDRLCRLSQDAGYDALGLYLEHRFAYASAPWAAGKGAVDAETIRWLRREHPGLRLIPFANLLGHMEGFLYASGGEDLAQERFKGMQAAPASPRVAAFARGLLDDVLAAFDDEIVHIGGDETQQLAASATASGQGEAELYGGYFGPMAQAVVEKGRRPGVWGDMFLEHPSALTSLPKETLVFDWQYFGSPRETARKFVDAGHEVVLCPTIHVYNAPWCHLPQTERNVRDHAEAAAEMNAYGVCVTTWEGALFASYETLLPAIAGCGTILGEIADRGSRIAEDHRLVLEDALSIQITPNGQLPDPNEGRDSPWVQMVETIIAQFLASDEPRLDLTYHSDRLAIEPGLGQLPLELAPNVLARLHLMADLSPLKSRERREGRILGTFDDQPFEIRAESFPTTGGIAFSLIRDHVQEPQAQTTSQSETRHELRLDGNPQLPDPNEYGEWGPGQAVQIVNTIIEQYLAQGRRLELAHEPGQLAILIDGRRNGQLPEAFIPEVLRRIALLAGMDPLKHRQNREGKITGTFDGEPFEVRAESSPTTEGIAFSLFRDPRSAIRDYKDLHEAPTLLRAYLKAGETNEEWARLMGVELQEAGGIFAFSQTRSPLKARLLLYGNPFLLWLRNREDLLGEPGDKALAVLDRAIAFAPDSGHRGVSEFVKIAIQTVRFVEESAVAYADHKPGVAAAALAPIRPAFDDLARIARATNLRIGGSLADIERCIVAKEHVERAMRRIKLYGDGSLGYLPSFETICHPKFMPHDQANWWLINSWANE